MKWGYAGVRFGKHFVGAYRQGNEKMLGYTQVIDRVGTIPVRPEDEIIDVRGDIKAGPFTRLYKNIATVYAGVYAIHSSGARVPLRVFQNRGKEMPLPLPDHSLQKLLDKGSGDKNSVTDDTFLDTKGKTLAFGELSGNAYWLLNGTTTEGTPLEIKVLNSARVKPQIKKGKKVYEWVTPGGKTEFLNKNEVIHFKQFSPTSELFGQGSIESAGMAALLEIYADIFTRRFFERGATLSGVIETEDDLPEAEMRRLITAFNENFGGADKAFKVKGLTHGLKFRGMQQSMVDMMFDKLRHMNRENILMAIGTPPVVVMLSDSSTFATAKEQKRMFWEITMLPKLESIAERINKDLVPLYNDDTIFVAFDLSGVDSLRPDMVILNKIAESMFKHGALTKNEWRQSINAARFPAFTPLPDGNQTFMPINLLPSDSEPAQPAKQITGSVKTVQEKLNDALKEIEANVAQRMQTRVDMKKLRRNQLIAFKKQTKQFRRIFVRSAKAMIKEQEVTLLDNLAELLARSGGNGDKVRSVEEFTLIFDELFEKNVATFKELFNQTVKASGEHSLFLLGVEGAEFNLLAQGVLDFITTQGAELVKHVDETTKAALRLQLTEGVANGESFLELSDRVKGTMKQRRFEANRIGRTETNRAFNFGSQESWAQSKVVETKEWLDSGDAEVREGHDDVDPVGINSSFEVNGEALMYPGDPNGSEENVINCRCTMLPRVVTDSSEDASLSLAIGNENNGIPAA